MALISTRVQVISRGDGRSAVAAAAYRSGKDLKSDRDQTVKQSRSKSAVGHSQIYAPEHAPEWATDRQRLWNSVETKAETRKNSQLAREIRYSLQRELSDEQNRAVIEKHVKREFVARGMVADVNIHHATASDGKPNPHAHVMLTLREFDQDGQWAAKKNRAWNSKELYREVRANWERDVNAALAEAGSAARVDRRSYKERGIDRLPQPKLGPTAAKLEQRGIASERGRELRRVEAMNQQKAMVAAVDRPPVQRTWRRAAPPAALARSREERKALAIRDHRAIVRQTAARAREHPGGLRGYLASQTAAAQQWRRAFLERQKARLDALREKARQRENRKGKGRGR